MNIKQKIISFAKLMSLMLTVLVGYSTANAQNCSISTSGPACVGEPISFNCGTIGATNFSWDFNGEATNTTLCNPSQKFLTPGNKTIKLTLTLSNGQQCASQIVINVKAKPIINIKRIVNKTQCFANNSFCFTDSSKSGDPNSTICKETIVFDDGTRYTFTGNPPRSFCHSFQDPAGGTYGVTIEIEDCNGCITKDYIAAVAVVQPSLGLNFTSPQPKACDSVKLCVTNNSTVPLDSIKNFFWDWGDGSKSNGDKTTPNLWQAGVTGGVCHWFKSQGPNGGNFTSKLSVTTNFGCTEVFTFNASATNLIIKPVIIADFDSLCFPDATFSFKLKDGPVPQAANPLYIYEQPPIPANITRQWVGSHKFGGVGPYQVTFSFTHVIPGCGRTVYDTILVIGPQSIIEGSILSGMRFLEDTQRYQCVIKDTVHFYNFSKFYHNDKNKVDDDSLNLIYDSAIINKTTKVILPSNTVFDPSKHEKIYGGFNKPLVHAFTAAAGAPTINGFNEQRGNDCTIRLWDFDDDYCEKCTTDTKNGVNVGKNCKYSKDTLPSHWYTPWDSLYQTRFSLTPESVLDFNRDSGLCYQKRMYSDDSVAIIRDTILYYGNNGQAFKTKDSTVYKNITNKEMISQSKLTGPARYDVNVATRFYLAAGDTAYVDLYNGSPPNRFTGPRFLTIQPGNAIVIYSKFDNAYFNVWQKIIQDTIPLHMVQSWHKVFKHELMPGYKAGDSVNAEAHRQKFYSGTTVRCFNVRLRHKDICHPLSCEHEATSTLALQPPSAKKLRKLGTLCLGSDQDNYGITFVLDDTKPGCSRTYAEINFDTALNKQGWNPAVGANLTPGSISMGGLPPTNPPYQVPIPGYQVNGPPGNRFSKQFTVDDIKDTITGYINVGLIIGNGMWPTSAADYPAECVDTVYYPKFARFPILDNRFRIVKATEGPEYTKICRKDTLSMTTLAWNRTYIPDVEEAQWSLTGANVGKYYNQYYVLSVNERYSRFQQVHKDTPYLVDKLQIVKRSFFDGRTTTLDSQNYRIAKVTKWHTEADITPVFDIIKAILEANKIDIYELTPAQLSELIWNGQGTFGKPFTGSRGCLDTTGFGRFIRFYKVADQKESLHFRDTTLLPVEDAKGTDGKWYKAYNFVPQYSGYYVANFGLRSTAPENCTKSTGTAKKVIVGFYGVMNYTDTILCHGQNVVASPQFRYFEVYPEITFRLLDPTDYWRNRILEAGNPNREDFTRTDLSKSDDGSDPKAYYGGFPYSITGLDNAPNQQLILGSSNGIYYNQDTGRSYIVRTAAGDSFGCKDTITQSIYVTAVRAKFRIDQNRPQCNTIIELFDSSTIQDPCVAELGTPCDRIVKWTVYWGDNKSNSINSFFNNLPSSVGHDYTRNGKFKIRWRVETALGCVGWDSVELYIPGPEPLFDTLIPRQYCVNEKVQFKNLSKYNKRDSSEWYWEFGDGTIDNQYDTITPANDTMRHAYTKPGKYKVRLTQYFRFQVGSTIKRCSVFYPDTTFGEREFEIEVFGYDSTKVIATPMKVCIGDTIKLVGKVFPQDRYSNYVWHFGKSLTDTLVTPDTVRYVTYAKEGKYSIKFLGDVNTVSSTDKICPMTDSVTVEVAFVEANFDIDSTRKPVFCFNNTSKNSVDNRWMFYSTKDLLTINPLSDRIFVENTKNNDPQVCNDYRDSIGSYWICLEATNDIGCKDTICKKIENNFRATILPPNVFSPNAGSDGFVGTDKNGLAGNDVFNIYIEGEDKYELVIYDRWGVKVFESSDKNNDWNGKVNNTGAECPDGTYYYILKYRYKGLDKDEPVLNGIVRIMR
ncbi:MAG TPA: PKD domain-containing protein [Bacteroidia bacterium]